MNKGNGAKLVDLIHLERRRMKSDNDICRAAEDGELTKLIGLEQGK